MKKRDARVTRKRAPPRGILAQSQPLVAGAITHSRYLAAAPLTESVEHWWSVRYHLPDGAHREVETLPHPSVHVVVERGEAAVFGVVRRRFTRVLSGHGAVFGAKFLPGAFYALLEAPLSSLVDRVVPLVDIIGERSADYLGGIERLPTDEERVAFAHTFFCELLPPPSDLQREVARIVSLAATDRSIFSVESLCDRVGTSVRSLQRSFRKLVGVSPKWVIQRYRLHEALAALDADEESLSDLALLLGYADLAHFSRDFKALVGCSPSRYLARRASRA